MIYENSHNNSEITKDNVSNPDDDVFHEGGNDNDINHEGGNDSDYYNQPLENWEELDAKMSLLRGIYSHGFQNPSPIQKRAIKPLFDGKDVIAQAQSGTGKTACFVIGSLQLINEHVNKTQVLIISPTRELSIQTKEIVDSIGNQMHGMRSHLMIGGTSIENDVFVLENKPPHIVIGCPGRIHDLLKRRKLNIKSLKLIVLDEADEMLSAGFKEQIYNIFEFLPKDVQVALFSATIPHELNNLTNKFMRNPMKILVKSEQLTLEGIQQYYIAIENDNHKYDALKDLYSTISVSQCIIYCNSVKRVDDLYRAMTADDFPVCQIHSNMDKLDRENSYKEFKNGRYRVLISSNVTARGIDIQQVSTVINFDLPKCIHTYLHRIGRSGRWGRKGVAVNFITAHDTQKIKEIEQCYSTVINELPASFVN